MGEQKTAALLRACSLRTKSVVGFVLSSAVLALAGCATPTLQAPNSDPAAVAREAAIQRRYVIDQTIAQNALVSRVMFRLSTGSADLCGETTTGLLGLSAVSAKQFPQPYEAVARSEFGFGDGLTITTIFPGSPAEAAGLLPGDRIIAIGRGRAADPAELRDSARVGQAIPVVVNRGGKYETLSAVPVLACGYATSISPDKDLNAWADGRQVVVNSGMLDFINQEEELAVVLSHEISHNILRHSEKQQENKVTGTLIGLAADLVIIAATGVNPQLYKAGSQIGAQVYTLDFEKEADYEGLYVMRRAGYNIDKAPEFWRRMGAANPGSISLTTDHPASAERFVAMTSTLAEIKAKEATRIALVPDLKPSKDGSAPTQVAAANSSVPAPGALQTKSVREIPVASLTTANAAPPIFRPIAPQSPFPFGIRDAATVTIYSIAAMNFARDPHGVAVGRLDPNGMAANAGIQSGDIIIAINGKRIDTVEDLKAFAAGNAADLKADLNRDGRGLSVRLR